MGGQNPLRPLLWSENAILDAYKESLKNELAAATTAAQAVLTAAFSVATAYGAVVALVKPKDAPTTPFILAFPFLGFGLAAVSATIGIAVGVKFKQTN